MKLYFDDPEFDQQLQRTFAKASSRVCDVGEVFAVAHRVEPGNLDSWHDEWFAAGESNRQLAESCEANGAGRDAGDAYLRASECYRSAYFFCRRDPHGAQLLESFRLSRTMFRNAIPNLPVAVEVVEIPYESDVTIPAYILWGSGDRSGPTVLIPAGYDSPVEESYSLGGLEAALRGMNVVMFGGPGQGEMLYERGLGFRPDFEAVVGPVLDFIDHHDALASDRVAIIGRSFGGYLAPRACVDRRIGVLAADPAQTDMFALIQAQLPAPWLKMIDGDDPAFNDEFWKANQGLAQQEHWLSRFKAHNLDQPLDYVREMKRWVVDVEAIHCPTYVSYGEGDYAEATSKDFYDRLTVPKHFEMFKDADGSGGHCEGMGQARYYAGVLSFIAQHLAP